MDYTSETVGRLKFMQETNDTVPNFEENKVKGLIEEKLKKENK